MKNIVLVGHALARSRAPEMARRAGAILAALGRPPKLLLLAFAEGPEGVPFVARKKQACDQAGVAVEEIILDPTSGTDEARGVLVRGLRESPVDGILIQWPLPPGIDQDTLTRSIPPALDIDVMSSVAIRQYLNSKVRKPPLTISAALALFDANGVDISGRHGILIGRSSPFNSMFCEAMMRRGARSTSIVGPDEPGMWERLSRAGLALASTGRPGLIRSSSLAPGAIAVDLGYTNAGARGDIDISSGTEGLHAIIPVPGGLGPMTISAMVEEVIARAEARLVLPQLPSLTSPTVATEDIQV